ncbi:hypothetical protein [Methylocella sp.]|uniref:hypothetical protein n=1 Tax=Methylocella sp. TaxID=1978226 RepID=UPI003783D187
MPVSSRAFSTRALALNCAGAALICACAALVSAAPASAQLMLPGALQAGPQTSSPPPAPGAAPAAPAKRKPVAQKPPGPETVVGKPLALAGAHGRIALARGAGDDAMSISELTLEGEQIEKRGEPCRLEVVAADAPLEAKLVGRPHGAQRYFAQIAACPFEFDLLDGAILARHEGGACVFAEADCRVDPNGVWGPEAASFDDKQIKQLEKSRGRAEATMRASFRALVAAAGKDQAAVKRFAAEQAGFSSEREMTCRSYAREETHGFCALKLTEARNLAINADLMALEKAGGARKKKGESARAP